MATCKPTIRRVAELGDWIIGTGSAEHERAGFGVYAMRVDEAMPFEAYWTDPRFTAKRPNLSGSRMIAFGDNIYRPRGDGYWDQLDSHHSFHDGSANPENVDHDTHPDRILASQHFIYWGGEGPKIPDHLRDFGEQHEDLCARTQGHKSRFSDELVAATVCWLDGFTDRGFQGRPGQWD